MQFHQIGGSGLCVSAVGLGCNNFGSRLDEDGTRAVVHAALDAGITLFDTADIYGEKGLSETYLGSALDGHRGDVVIATKFGMDMLGTVAPPWLPRGSREYVRRAVEGSLRRLGTDYIDLYQFHEVDPVTPIEETLGVLTDLVREGKIRYVGCSNFEAWRLVHATWAARAAALEPFVSAQVRYHLLDRSAEADVRPAGEAMRMGILPYYPLANGLLTGKYRPGHVPSGSRLEWRSGWATVESLERVERIRQFADARGIGVLDVAIGWLLGGGGVSSVIAGAMNAEQVRGNARAAAWLPATEDLDELDLIVAPGERVV